MSSPTDLAQAPDAAGQHGDLRSAILQPPRPILTAIAVIATLAGTCTRLASPHVFLTLRRSPSGLRHGQWWRVISPVLVQGDHSVLAIVGVFVLCAVVGTAGEKLLPRVEWLLLYAVGAVVGEAIGETFQPHQSGMSVAFAGILGGLAARFLLTSGPGAREWRVRAAILIPLAILDTALRDIHGLPFLAGLAVGLLFEFSGRARASRAVRTPFA